MSTRPFDIIVYGATGYSGELTAEHIAQNKRGNGRWAIAGRSLQKLVKLKDHLIQINPDFGAVEIFTCMRVSNQLHPLSFYSHLPQTSRFRIYTHHTHPASRFLFIHTHKHTHTRVTGGSQRHAHTHL